jgi:hypothetical protein
METSIHYLKAAIGIQEDRAKDYDKLKDNAANQGV